MKNNEISRFFENFDSEKIFRWSLGASEACVRARKRFLRPSYVARAALKRLEGGVEVRGMSLARAVRSTQI